MVSSREYVHIMRIISEFFEDFYDGPEMIFVAVTVFSKTLAKVQLVWNSLMLRFSW
jgi:hypothetical protein